MKMLVLLISFLVCGSNLMAASDEEGNYAAEQQYTKMQQISDVALKETLDFLKSEQKDENIEDHSEGIVKSLGKILNEEKIIEKKSIEAYLSDFESQLRTKLEATRLENDEFPIFMTMFKLFREGSFDAGEASVLTSKCFSEFYKRHISSADFEMISVLEKMGWDFSKNSHDGSKSSHIFNDVIPTKIKETQAGLLRALSRSLRNRGDSTKLDKENKDLLFASYTLGHSAANIYQDLGDKKLAAESLSHAVVGLRMLLLRDSETRDDKVAFNMYKEIVTDLSFKALDLRLNDNSMEKAQKWKWVASSYQALMEVYDLDQTNLEFQVLINTLCVVLRTRANTMWGLLDSYRRLGEALVESGHHEYGLKVLEKSIILIENNIGGKGKTLAEIGTFIAEWNRNNGEISVSGDYDGYKKIDVENLVKVEVVMQGSTAASDDLSLVFKQVLDDYKANTDSNDRNSSKEKEEQKMLLVTSLKEAIKGLKKKDGMKKNGNLVKLVDMFLNINHADNDSSTRFGIKYLNQKDHLFEMLQNNFSDRDEKIGELLSKLLNNDAIHQALKEDS